MLRLLLGYMGVVSKQVWKEMLGVCGALARPRLVEVSLMQSLCMRSLLQGKPPGTIC